MALKFDFKEAQPCRETALELAAMQPEANEILVCRINSVLSDLSSCIKRGDVVEFLTFENSEGKKVFWHSSAHILGSAILNLHPEAKLSSGPATENGFFYDVWLEKPFSEDDYAKIEKEFQRIVKLNFNFEKTRMKKEDLIKFYANNPYKTHFVKEKVEEESSVYKIGNFTDFCLGPHLKSTSAVKAFKVLKNSSTYFLGDSTRDTLQRIVGVSFPSKEMLFEFLRMHKEAIKRDHRKVGLEMELFFFHRYAAGSAFFLPEGTIVYKNLIEFLQEEYKKRGFEEVITPNIFSLELWKESGHLENYKENMFLIEGDTGLKPMNCPGHCIMFRHRERTYKELPIRWADFGVLHRNELSGALTGLTRVRRFQQDDAHIFCSMEQIYTEIQGCIEFLEHVYAKLNFCFEILLSTRPKSFIGDVKDWNKAEEALIKAISNRKYRVNEGDGAFYGPKLDVVITDALNRKHQCATIQLDFQLPKRFNLRFKKGDGSYETPVIVHRAIFGSIERMIAIIIENYGKRLPFWLSPRQIAVVPVTPQVSKYVEYFCEKFNEFRIRVFENVDSTFNKRIRNAQMSGYCIIVVIGKKESEEGKLSVRINNKSETYEVEELYNMLKWRKINRLDIPVIEDLKL